MSSPIKILKQAIINPEKFYILGNTPNALYNSTPFDETWFKDSFKSWQNRSEYSMKRQFEDVSVLQFHMNGSQVFLSLIDCNQKVYKDFVSVVSSYPGMTAQYNGVEYPLSTHTFFTEFEVQDNNTPIPEGTYYMLLSASYETQFSVFVTDYYISEPIYIAETQENTVYLEYKHSRNQLDTIFAAFGNGLYSIRIEGMVDELRPKAQDTQYNDQHFNFAMLNSYPYRQWKLFLGEVIGIPKWIWEKVHLGLTCDFFKADNSQYTKDESAEWNAIEDSERVWADIQLRETTNYAKLTTINIEPLIIFEIPPYPFFEHSMQIGGMFHYVSLPAYNDTDLNAILDYHNTVIKPAQGLLGVFSLDTNNLGIKRLIYIPNPADVLVTADSRILTKVININNPTVSTNTLTLNMTYTAIGIVWGDGGYEGGGDDMSPISTPIDHNYAGTGGNKIANIFHEDGATLTGINIHHGIFDIYGDCPSAMDQFELQGTVMSTWDANFLNRATALLGNLVIANNTQLSGITNMYQAWQVLTAIIFTGNVLMTSSVNQILVDLDNSAIDFGNWSTVLLQMNGQTPAAPPSGAGSTAKTHLTGTYFWTVTTD